MAPREWVIVTFSSFSDKQQLFCTSGEFHNTCTSASQLKIQNTYTLCFPWAEKDRSFIQYSDKLLPSNYQHCNSKLSIQHNTVFMLLILSIQHNTVIMSFTLSIQHTHCHYVTHTVNTAQHCHYVIHTVNIPHTHCHYVTHTVNTVQTLSLSLTLLIHTVIMSLILSIKRVHGRVHTHTHTHTHTRHYATHTVQNCTP